MKFIIVVVVIWIYYIGCFRKKDKKIVNFLVGGKGDSFIFILNIILYGIIRKENMDSWRGNFCKFF